MFLAFLSRRFRNYLLFALVLPVAGRLLEGVGMRVGRRSPRAGQVLGTAGGYARRPPTELRRMYRGRRR